MRLVKSLIFSALLPYLLVANDLDLEFIADLLFKRECGGKKENLAYWSAYEGFPSFGIGHFTWTHQNPQDSQFYQLIVFLEKKGSVLPQWLHKGPCPWPSKRLFDKDKDRLEQLRHMLWQTRIQQAEFAIQRFEKNLQEIERRYSELRPCIESLTNHPYGYYALLDYNHFKGSGLNSQKSSKGTGLVEVLLDMDTKHNDPLKAFVESAERALRRRVSYFQHRREKRFLDGWIRRVQSYLQLRDSMMGRIDA